MANPTFASILDRDPSTIERPKPIPQGTYICVVQGQPRFDKSSKKGTEFVEFDLAPRQYEEDVDEDALKVWSSKADGSTRSLKEAKIRATYYLTEDAIWRLKKFLVDDLGIEEGKNLRQMIAQAPNKSVRAFVKHVPSEDGQSVFAQLATTSPVEA